MLKRLHVLLLIFLTLNLYSRGKVETSFEMYDTQNRFVVNGGIIFNPEDDLYTEMTLARTSFFLDEELFVDFGFDWLSVAVPLVAGAIMSAPSGSSRKATGGPVAPPDLSVFGIFILGNFIMHPKINIKLTNFISLNAGYDADIYIWKHNAFMLSPFIGAKIHNMFDLTEKEFSGPYLFYDFGFSKIWSDSPNINRIENKTRHVLGIGF
jgi:hypothetical protein